MNRFALFLAKMNERLILPQPLKYRIMKEIAADLEDTFALYTEKGFDEQAAEAKTLEKIAADDSVINDLIEVHETPVRKILRSLSERTQYRIETGLWITLLLLAGIMVSAMLIHSDILAGSPFNWLTGSFITGIFAISLTKYYELFVKRDHSIQKIHRGLPLLIFICCLAVLTGTIGFFAEMQQSMGIIAYSGFQDIVKATALIFQSIAVICFSLVTSVVGAVLWLILTMKTLEIEDQEHVFQFVEK